MFRFKALAPDADIRMEAAPPPLALIAPVPSTVSPALLWILMLPADWEETMVPLLVSEPPPFMLNVKLLLDASVTFALTAIGAPLVERVAGPPFRLITPVLKPDVFAKVSPNPAPGETEIDPVPLVEIVADDASGAPIVSELIADPESIVTTEPLEPEMEASAARDNVGAPTWTLPPTPETTPSTFMVEPVAPVIRSMAPAVLLT